MDSRMRGALDRHITGNYGEDQFRDYDPASEEAGDCDWGNCDNEAHGARYTRQATAWAGWLPVWAGWLPVCDDHLVGGPEPLGIRLTDRQMDAWRDGGNLEAVLDAGQWLRKKTIEEEASHVDLA